MKNIYHCFCRVNACLYGSYAAKAEETVMPLNASRIDSEKLPSGNLIYLGTRQQTSRKKMLFIRSLFIVRAIYRKKQASQSTRLT